MSAIVNQLDLISEAQVFIRSLKLPGGNTRYSEALSFKAEGLKAGKAAYSFGVSSSLNNSPFLGKNCATASTAGVM